MFTSLYIFITKQKQDKEVYKFVLLINRNWTSYQKKSNWFVLKSSKNSIKDSYSAAHNSIFLSWFFLQHYVSSKFSAWVLSSSFYRRASRTLRSSLPFLLHFEVNILQGSQPVVLGFDHNQAVPDFFNDGVVHIEDWNWETNNSIYATAFDIIYLFLLMGPFLLLL